MYTQRCKLNYLYTHRIVEVCAVHVAAKAD